MMRCATNAIATPNGAGSAAARLRVVPTLTEGAAIAFGATTSAFGGVQPLRRPRLE